jgi:hypothetical protein
VQFNSAGSLAGNAGLTFVPPDLFLGAGSTGIDSLNGGQVFSAPGSLIVTTGAFLPGAGGEFLGLFTRIGNLVTIYWTLFGTISTGAGNELDLQYTLTTPPFNSLGPSPFGVIPPGSFECRDATGGTITITYGGWTRLPSPAAVPQDVQINIVFGQAHVGVDMFISGSFMFATTSAP